MLGYLEKGIHTPVAQGRSTKTISMIKWIRTSRLSIKNSPSLLMQGGAPCLKKATGEQTFSGEEFNPGEYS